jgi:3-hydroxyisobutyrate dehydrogenase-like beta-hydroxyacid dehydrogenase
MHLLVIYIGIASSFSSVGYEFRPGPIVIDTGSPTPQWDGMANETANLKIGKFLDAPISKTLISLFSDALLLKHNKDS